MSIYKRIFENIPKSTGNKLASQAESKYAYLRDSERPSATLIRNTIEQWFHNYCLIIEDNEKINDLHSRLQNKDNIQFLGAFTELYAFILLRNFGYEILAEEKTENGKKPDFLIKNSDGKEFYVEVTTMSEKQFNENRNKAINLIIDKINKKIKSPTYYIELIWNGIPLENDINSTVLNDIQQWIANPNEIAFTRDFNNKWTLTLLAVKASASQKNDNGIIITFKNSKVQCYSKNFKNTEFTTSAEIENVVDFVPSIKESLTNKANHYGQLNKPYIIIINLLSEKIDESVIEDAILSGTLTGNNRISSSFFSKQTNVNGVLVAFNLDPWNMLSSIIPRKESLYFINPNAKEDFDNCGFKELFDITKLRDNVHRLDTIKTSEHLKLSQKEWDYVLEQEDPDFKFSNAIKWMQNSLKNFKL